MAFLSQASHLGSLLLPHDAFQEYAAHPAEWSAGLNSNGSERTCIRSGLATFLHCACTAHPNYVVECAIAHRKSRVAYLGAADNVLEPLASCLRNINQPVLYTRNAFSTLLP